MPKYLQNENKEGKDGNTVYHNKFWEYEILNDTSVMTRWGRVGVDGQEKKYDFGSRTERDRFIQGKVAEKTNPKKGYKLVTEEVLEKERKTAETLGNAYLKINRIEYVNKKGEQLRVLGDYDPEEHVYVEVVNSQTKEKIRYLFQKNQSWKLEGIAEASQLIEFDDLIATADSLSKAVRQVLKSVAQAVVRIVAQKFAAVGARSLDLGLDDEESVSGGGGSGFDLFAMVKQPGVSKQVVSKFASLGNRTLEL